MRDNVVLRGRPLPGQTNVILDVTEFRALLFPLRLAQDDLSYVFR